MNRLIRVTALLTFVFFTCTCSMRDIEEPEDTNAPDVYISFPDNGALIQGTVFEAAGMALDTGENASGVLEVKARLNDGEEISAEGTTVWTVRFEGVAEGEHVLYVYALDRAGNTGSAAELTFSLEHPHEDEDETAPQISIAAPESGAVLSGSTVDFSGTAFDPGTPASGVQSVSVKLDTTGWFTASGTTAWSYTFSDVPAGSRSVSVYARDHAGNTSETVSISFTVEEASPYPYIVGGVFTPQSGDPEYTYYQSAAGLSGNTLRTALKTIITTGHSVSSYAALWTAYASTDLIPSGVNQGKVWDMYSDAGTGQGGPYYFTYGSDQCGNYSGENSCYNREHSWPKSWFSDALPMINDIVHVVPTDGYVNGMRGSYAYGIVGTASWTSQNGSKRGSPTGQMTGWGCTESVVFEPIDAFKGDFARIYFYMCTRYRGTSESGPMTSSNFSLKPWAQTLLLLWHENDPVSAKETSRNDGIENHQGNRNPYVDYPGLVTIIDFTQ